MRVALSVKVRGESLPSLHVIAVHASGKGYERDQLFTTIEHAIRPSTLAVAGDLNEDLRARLIDKEKFPKVAKWAQQASKLSATAVSTSKERSLFQTQVSKALQPDVSLKDFVLLNEAGGAGLSAVLEISDFGADLFVIAEAVEQL